MATTLLAAAFGAAVAHEYWIEPETGIVEAGQSVNLHLRNGETFAGGSFPFVPAQFVLFDVIDAAGRRPVTSVMGSFPALPGFTPGDDGATFLYVSTPRTLDFKSFISIIVHSK